MQILLVEDDVSSAKMIRTAIERWDHHVELAETGKKALEKARNNTFDLVLLDIMLPDVVGYELIPEFKRYDSGIQIITMTGYNTPEMERKIRGYGITYYMTKPVPFHELESILNHLSEKCKKEETE
ncbi:MAG: response regulator [Deltaproteobacteria bacterium]|nr:response regulator [Deltaproteobacteria bacterium]